jgi:hypothetical protein
MPSIAPAPSLWVFARVRSVVRCHGHAEISAQDLPQSFGIAGLPHQVSCHEVFGVVGNLVAPAQCR